jgi:hypothetical protein
MTSRCGCGGLGHPTGRLIALASARQAARYHAARRAVREVPRCQGIGRTLSGSCAMPGCCPGRTRASHRATVQTSLTRYVTFELPEQAPPCSTRSPGWHAASLSTRCNPRDRVASLIGPALPPTLHQLRHSALTHAAEDGTNLPLLLARSRHASVRSLERYAHPGPEAVARHLADTDPTRRRP